MTYRLSLIIALPLLAISAGPAAQAKVVARDIQILMDQSDPSHASDVGKVHEARIFYDGSKIDPVTHHVAILHEQHTPMYIPFHPDAAEMPVANAWLDLSKKPYAIVFDEDSHRMTIRRQSDGGLELSGPYTVSEEALTGPDIDWVINGSGPPTGNQAGAKAPAMTPPTAPPPAAMAHAPKPEPVPPLVSAKGGHLVALKVTIVVDQVAPEDEGMYKVGAVDTARIVYDTAQINPVTHTVPLLEEAHLIAGHYHTNRITGASQLSLGSEPYHLTYASAVNHGRDLVVLFEGASNRMAMLARPDFHMLIAGHYVIDSKPVPYDPAHPEK